MSSPTPPHKIAWQVTTSSSSTPQRKLVNRVKRSMRQRVCIVGCTSIGGADTV